VKTFTSRSGGNVTDATAVAAVIWVRLPRRRRQQHYPSLLSVSTVPSVPGSWRMCHDRTAVLGT
jgi:hypothetical protein